MELSSEVFLWLEPTIAKRAALQSSADPIQALVDTLEAVRLAKYLIGRCNTGLLLSLTQVVIQVAVFTFLLHDIGENSNTGSRSWLTLLASCDICTRGESISI